MAIVMRDTKTTNDNEKTTLIAKLMSTENISVRFDHVETAAFDLQNRELMLPIYEGLSQNVYNMMVAHEVSHALNTPWTKWSDFVQGDSTKQQYANILEDVRIERLIKKRYPGVIREMKAGYRDIHDRDFFGIANKDLSGLSLIDRLNLHFKSYGHISVPFAKNELHWIEKADSTQTFDDVMALVNELYEAESQPEEQEPEQGDGEESNDQENNEDSSNQDQNQNNETESGDDAENDSNDDADSDDADGDDSDAGDDSGDDTEGDDADGDNDSENETEDDFLSKALSGLSGDDEDSADSEIEDGEDGEISDDPANENASKGIDDEGTNASPIEPAESETQRNLEENLKDSRVQNSNRPGTAVVSIPELDARWKNLVISANDFLETERYNMKNFRNTNTDDDIDALLNTYRELSKTNKKVINHMVKEFEMKKSAAAQKRSMTSKTGAIDMDRLYEYRTNDDLFLRNTTVPEGKNHGVVMYVDFSGSMAGGRVANSMAQIFNMVSFCSKVGIPYVVYAFANGGWNFQNGVNGRTDITAYRQLNEDMSNGVSDSGTFRRNRLYGRPGQGTRVVEIINNELSKKDWLLAMGLIAGVAQDNPYGNVYNFFRHNYSGGTPLNTALYIAPYIINDFTRRNAIDKTIFMLYTDGGAGDRYMVGDNSTFNYNYADAAMMFFDPAAKKTWKSEDVFCRRGTEPLQNVLTDRISATTNAMVMGFDIVPAGTGHFVLDSAKKMNGYSGFFNYRSAEAQNFKKTFRKEGFHHVTSGFGFDSFTFVSEKNSVENVELENELKGDTASASTRQLQGAFVRSNRKTNDSRFLVKKLMDVIA